MPSLRERRTDIPMLVEYFLTLYAEAYNRTVVPFDQHVMDAFMSADWPGNIRELENVVHLALLVAGDRPVRPEHLKFSAGLSALQDASSNGVQKLPQEVLREQFLRLFDVPGDSLLHDIEELMVREAFAYCDFNQLRTAQLLGITRNAMRTLLVNHGMLKGRAKP